MAKNKRARSSHAKSTRRKIKPAKAPTCRYCGDKAKLVTGEAIYPAHKELWARQFWECRPCGAYVGCHRKCQRFNSDGSRPLGELANRALRRLRGEAHQVFDRIWKNDEMGRNAAYQWLSDQLKIKRRDCHIGHFDEPQCRQVIQVCYQRGVKF